MVSSTKPAPVSIFRRRVVLYPDMKISKKQIDKELRVKAMKVLFTRLRNVISLEDAERFLNMFFKKQEKSLILKKAAVMVLLSEGEKYRSIEERLEVSRATISNVRDIFNGREYGGKDPRQKKPARGGNYPPPKKFKRYKLRYKGAPPLSDIIFGD